ncbi:MAG: choice-of-anchor B family protein [bacterium]|nr:choice-of-anchor B family protein [bacterium]
MRISHTLLAAATVLAAPIAAQGVNCALLGTFNNHGPFNDIWGYVAPNGDEYALLCTTTGTVVVDVTNPASPVERGWFPWGNSSWRDARTYGNYAYIVTESTAGFQVIDLSNPNSPTLVGTRGTGNSNNAHNVCVDLGTGRLYLVGCNTGTPVYDLTSNPSNPSFLGFGLPGGNSNYFHDLCVENGYAYGSMIYNGVLRIIDPASPFPWAALSNRTTPNSFTHNAWPNAAGTVCVTTDEQTGGVVKFWDISNKSNPQSLGQYTPNPSSIPHNAFIVGDKCHVSWYTEGYRCIDISDPNNPVEVASYDTWPGASGGFSGCWGVYPFLPSGNILVSDRSTGLYIVRPTQASFSNYGQGCAGSVPAPATCASLNPNGGTLSNSTNQYEYSYRVSNSGNTLQVSSVDIYTRSQNGTLTRPAHIYQFAGNVPSQTPLASTTITVGTTAGFYTATFNPPVTVTGDFCVGYENSPDGVISNLNGGSSGTGYYRNAGSGSWQQSQLVQSPSYRIFCAGGSQNFLTPELGNAGAPVIGGSYDVTLADAVASSAAFIVTGFSDQVFNGTQLPAAIPGAPGCDIYAAPQATLLTFTNGAGEGNASFNVPNSGAYAGLEMFHQWAILDPTVNSIGIVVSDAGKATIDF